MKGRPQSFICNQTERVNFQLCNILSSCEAVMVSRTCKKGIGNTSTPKILNRPLEPLFLSWQAAFDTGCLAMLQNYAA